jgi:hypothetical protein
MVLLNLLLLLFAKHVVVKHDVVAKPASVVKLVFVLAVVQAGVADVVQDDDVVADVVQANADDVVQATVHDVDLTNVDDDFQSHVDLDDDGMVDVIAIFDDYTTNLMMALKF